jgi:DNA helicase IV
METRQPAIRKRAAASEQPTDREQLAVGERAANAERAADAKRPVDAERPADAERAEDQERELEAERAFMGHARRSMAAMRRAVEALPPQAASRVDKEILEAKLAQRVESLRDDPNVPLFFGRIDLRPSHETGQSEQPEQAEQAGRARDGGETFHIGRRHVKDAKGDPVVVDWRADVSMPFYRATRHDPMGLTRRRRFGFDRGEVTAMEDELLELGDLEDEVEGLSPLVAAEIERPRTGPMRDIVATIQPEQDEIVRAGLAESICVQGGPGTGKTAVGLHRAAYLLHAFASQLKERGILVVGPNDAFIRYIGAVLPSLGEVGVDQVPLGELLAHPSVVVRAPEAPDIAVLKHDARMADVIRRATEGRMAAPESPLVVRVGATPVRLEPRDLERVRTGVLGRRLPYEAGRRVFRDLVAAKLLAEAETMIGGVTASHIAQALRSGKPARDTVGALWPKVDPVDVVFRLLNEPETLAAAAGTALSPGEQALLSWKRRTTKGRAPWTPADLVLVDEASGAVARPPGYAHVVVDEAQDLSPMELRAVGRRCRRSVTLLGDLAQATTPWGSSSWAGALRHLGLGEARVETLYRAFRIQASVLELANRLLPSIAPSLPPAVAVRDAPDALTVVPTAPQDLVRTVADQVASILRRPGSVGVIVPPDQRGPVADALSGAGADWGAVADMATGRRVTLLEPAEAKGLEFDVVVLVEPEALARSGQAAALRLLYIAITRAVLRLVLVHASPLPPELAVA